MVECIQRIFILFSVIVFAHQIVVYGQKENIVFQHFSISEGLSEPITYSAIQDKEGYLWFGTWGGIEKYDGYKFTAHKHDPDNPNSIDNAFVETLYEDKEGYIWVGTWLGLEKFDKETGYFIHYKPDGLKPKSEWSNHVFSICEDVYGKLWIGTGDGLYTFDKMSEKFTSFRHDDKNPRSLAHNAVMIYEDKEANLWFGTGKGLDKLERSTGNFIHYYYGTGQEFWGTSKYWVLSIFEDESGILWLGTNGGLIEFNKADSTFFLYEHSSKDPNSLSGNIVKSIAQDGNGILWLCTTGTGISNFDKQTKTFLNYRHDDNNQGSLNSDWTFSVLCDRSGTVWITTFDGLNKFSINQKPFVNYSPGNIITIIKGNDNKLWVQTPERLLKLFPETGTIINKKLVNGFDELRMEDDKGNLWIAEEGGGLYTLKKNGDIEKYFSDNGNEFTSIVTRISQTSDNNIWVGTESDGLYVLNKSSQRLTKVKIPAKDINEVYEDNFGMIWIGSRMRGLYSYDLKTDSVKSYLYDKNDPTTLSGQTVLDIQEDKYGGLWIGTNIGLNKFDRSNGTFKHFTEKDGLPTNAVFTILFDDQNYLWLDTRKGISKFNTVTNTIQNFNASDGLPTDGFIDYQGVKLDNGWMYFAGNYDVIGFYPDSIKNNTFIPPIVITNFLKFNKPYPIQKKVELTYIDNFLSFEFAALSYVNPEKNQYAYKMEGLDKDWIYSGTRRYASYPNLEPGEYVFRVKGSNNDGVWNEQGASMIIFITPPFWQTWWFRISVLLLIFISIGGSLRFIEMRRFKRKIEKLEQERELERERARISQDMHDEVGSSLSEIAILSELAKKKPNEAQFHIGEISERAAEVIESVSEIVWAMNPQNDKLDNLIAHTRRYAVKYLNLSNIECKFALPEIIPSYLLSAELRRNIFLVVKEVLHNIVKHSGANEVLFKIEITNRLLNIKIEDNGRGFSVKELSGLGNGLINMRKRIQDITGNIQIDSAPDKGTQINFSVNIT